MIPYICLLLSYHPTFMFPCACLLHPTCEHWAPKLKLAPIRLYLCCKPSLLYISSYSPGPEGVSQPDGDQVQSHFKPTQHWSHLCSWKEKKIITFSSIELDTPSGALLYSPISPPPPMVPWASFHTATLSILSHSQPWVTSVLVSYRNNPWSRIDIWEACHVPM